jgi:hypothetical protein
MEAIIVRVMIVKKINDDNVAVFDRSIWLNLIVSQSIKVSLFLDLLALSLNMYCSRLEMSVPQIVFLMFYVLFSWYEFLKIFRAFYHPSHHHGATYINLVVRLAYCSDYMSFQALLEKFATSPTTDVGSLYVPQLIVMNVLRFIVQNIPSGIIQIVTLYKHPETHYFFYISFSIAIFSSIRAYYTTITLQPTICNSDMLCKLVYNDFTESMTLADPKLEAKKEKRKARLIRKMEEGVKKNTKVKSKKTIHEIKHAHKALAETGVQYITEESMELLKGLEGEQEIVSTFHFDMDLLENEYINRRLQKKETEILVDIPCDENADIQAPNYNNGVVQHNSFQIHSTTTPIESEKNN